MGPNHDRPVIGGNLPPVERAQAFRAIGRERMAVIEESRAIYVARNRGEPVPQPPDLPNPILKARGLRELATQLGMKKGWDDPMADVQDLHFAAGIQESRAAYIERNRRRTAGR